MGVRFRGKFLSRSCHFEMNEQPFGLLPKNVRSLHRDKGLSLPTASAGNPLARTVSPPLEGRTTSLIVQEIASWGQRCSGVGTKMGTAIHLCE
jgi:hypothetical protein